jgi:hypothetical protein
MSELKKHNPQNSDNLAGGLWRKRDGQYRQRITPDLSALAKVTPAGNLSLSTASIHRWAIPWEHHPGTPVSTLET